MADHAWGLTMGHKPFQFSNLDAVLATFQMVNSIRKWKVTLPEALEVEVMFLTLL